LQCHLKSLNDMASYRPLDATKQNIDHKMAYLHFT